MNVVNMQGGEPSLLYIYIYILGIQMIYKKNEYILLEQYIITNNAGCFIEHLHILDISQIL